MNYSSREISEIINKPLHIVLKWARKNPDKVQKKYKGKQIIYVWDKTSIEAIKQYYNNLLKKNDYFSSKYVAKLLNLTQATVNKWAQKNNVYIEIINGKSHYFWTQIDIDFLIDFRKNYEKKKTHQKKTSTNLNTLYRRALRAEDKGLYEEAKEYRIQIKELREKNSNNE